MQEALKRPLPRSLLKSKRVKGTRLDYIPWYRANDILDKYCPGWTWEIREMQATRDRIFITGRLTVPTSEGHIYREATGTEELKREVTDQETGEVFIEEIVYGDPSSNAESMAFRRCAARFGLGLYLYEK